MLDLYFEEKYGLLYEGIEKGACAVFEHRSDFGVVRHLFIKRRVPVRPDRDEYYELVTPYGYGGPVITQCTGEKKELGRAFEAAFRVTANPDSLDAFQEMYHETMKRKAADDVYFFDAVYFRNLLHYLGEYVLLVEVEYEGTVIGMGLNSLKFRVPVPKTIQFIHYNCISQTGL